MAKANKAAETPAPSNSVTLLFQSTTVTDTQIQGNDAKRTYLFPVSTDPVDGTQNPNKALAQGGLIATIELTVDQPDMLVSFQAGAQYEITITKK